MENKKLQRIQLKMLSLAILLFLCKASGQLSIPECQGNEILMYLPKIEGHLNASTLKEVIARNDYSNFSVHVYNSNYKKIHVTPRVLYSLHVCIIFLISLCICVDTVFRCRGLQPTHAFMFTTIYESTVTTTREAHSGHHIKRFVYFWYHIKY